MVDGRFFEHDDAGELAAELGPPRRDIVFGGGEAPLETMDVERVLGAQRVAIGDRLRFAQGRKQTRARAREPTRAAGVTAGAVGQRKQRGRQEPDGGKDCLLDQFRLVAGANRTAIIARRRRSSQVASTTSDPGSAFSAVGAIES